MKNWLPITVRNRVALLIIAGAVFLFLICNFLPYYEFPHHRYFQIDPTEYHNLQPEFKCRFYQELWSDVFDLDSYVNLFRSPDMHELFSVVSNLLFLSNAVIMLLLIPYWKFFHASIYLRIPIAVSNFYFAFIALQISIGFQQGSAPVSSATLYMLISIVTSAVGAALIIFENELPLQHEIEVKKIMANGVVR